MTVKWYEIGSGTYNTAYTNEQKTLVLKIQHDKEGKTDQPQRSARLWNELNFDLLPLAYLASTEYGDGWVCPYVEGIQASDNEMSQALFDIYTRTGRIVIDAPAPNNFIKTAQGKIVCVDIGLALQTVERKDEYLERGLVRRNSDVSLEAWEELAFGYNAFFYTHSFTSPKTINTIKSLLFIQSNRPDITDVTFLKTNITLVEQLATAYDEQNEIFSQKSLKKLETTFVSSVAFQKKILTVNPILQKLSKDNPMSLSSIQTSCTEQLTRYIRSRGFIDIKGNYNPSWVTRLFRDEQRTSQKVAEAQALIKIITTASSFKELNAMLCQPLQKEGLLRGDRSGFMSRLSNCLLIVNFAEKNLNQLSLNKEMNSVSSKMT